MKTQLLVLCLLTIPLFSCDKENEDPIIACGVSDPINNLPWLKELVEDAAAESEFSQYSYISQGIYDGETVFYNGSCCPNCNWILVLYDCSGNTIEKDYTLNDIKNPTVLWKAENSLCEFN